MRARDGRGKRVSGGKEGQQTLGIRVILQSLSPRALLRVQATREKGRNKGARAMDDGC